MMCGVYSKTSLFANIGNKVTELLTSQHKHQIYDSNYSNLRINTRASGEQELTLRVYDLNSNILFDK